MLTTQTNAILSLAIHSAALRRARASARQPWWLKSHIREIFDRLNDSIRGRIASFCWLKKKEGFARGASLGVAAANYMAALPLCASRWVGATPGMLPRACALV